jgi:hypothetical protein
VRIKPDETEIIGNWIIIDGRASSDAAEERINKLISNYLEKLAISSVSGGWDVLYRDPIDGRLWELTYPQGHMHGGGPKRLSSLSAAMAMAKYHLPAESSDSSA